MAERPDGGRRRLPGSTVPRRRDPRTPRAVLPVDEGPADTADIVDVEEFVRFRPVADLTPETLRPQVGGPSLFGWFLVMSFVILGVVAYIAYRMAPP
jgi:hypothetical protein